MELDAVWSSSRARVILRIMRARHGLLISVQAENQLKKQEQICKFYYNYIQNERAGLSSPCVSLAKLGKRGEQRIPERTL